MIIELIKDSSFGEIVHGNQKIIRCLFPYYPQLLENFRKESFMLQNCRRHIKYGIKYVRFR